MRLVSIHNCEEGLILAKPILDSTGRILLNQGSTLSSTFIARLKMMNIPFLYVQSELTSDIEVNKTISPQIRLNTSSKLKEVFSSITDQKASKKEAIGRVRLIKDLSTVFEQMMKDLNSSDSLLDLLSDMQTPGNAIFEHSINTCLYSISMGKQLKMKENELHLLGMGALFHDIGKLSLPEDSDQSELRKHPEVGFDMLRKQDMHLLTAHCAYQHHENVDGTGFPRGLKGNQIHIFAKIISVAEAFDHLVMKKSFLPHEAMEMILARCYTRFDPEVVEAFKNSIAIYPIGLTVLLNTGETGVVIGNNANFPQRPKVRLFKDKSGQKLKEFIDINLMTSLSTMIVRCDAIIA
ncbi:HD-GYP domain-containing protein [Neobacillus sp. D3-1R]|uniref:HD-GYP domain-containing protein n=1 Tax=Neobacillus sp. D3-1R TaxID=3445778 RepID=UPI003F9FD33F